MSTRTRSLQYGWFVVLAVVTIPLYAAERGGKGRLSKRSSNQASRVATKLARVKTAGKPTPKKAAPSGKASVALQDYYGHPTVGSLADYYGGSGQSSDDQSQTGADDNVIYLHAPLYYFDACYVNASTAESQSQLIINAYLLSRLSDAVYSDQFGYSQEWIADFENKMLSLGAVDVDFMAHPDSGAEVAVVETVDALIVVHRGSHYNGTPLNLTLADWINDLDDDAIEKTIGGTNMYVHEGFWRTADSVYNWVRDHARDAHDRGKKIWLTGHSLGAANATFSAARLHYDDGIPVQGLQTFGSPKVANLELQKLFTYAGADGIALEDVSHRWAVEGDIVTTLFQKDNVLHWYITPFGFNYPGWITIYYQHVGKTHQIYRTASGIDYTIDLDSEDRSNTMSAGLGSLSDEHGAYTDGIEAELIRVLQESDDTNTLTAILRGQ